MILFYYKLRVRKMSEITHIRQYYRYLIYIGLLLSCCRNVLTPELGRNPKVLLTSQPNKQSDTLTLGNTPQHHSHVYKPC